MRKSCFINLLSRIAMTTGSIMPVDCILLVKIDSRREICNGLIVLKEAIPYKPATVISWCVLGIKLDYTIEVFQSLFKAITANFLSNSTKMMYRLHIILL